MSNTRRINAALRYGMVFALVFGQMAPAYAQQTYYRYTIGDSIPLNAGSDEDDWVPPPGNGNNTDEPSGELRIEISPSVRARIGVAMNLRLEAQGADGAVEWSIGGNTLPKGLSFNAATGTVTGTPTIVGQIDGFSVRGVDSTGREGWTRRFSIDVQPAPVVTFPALLAANDTADLSVTPSAVNVFGSQTWSVEGVLPYGISVDAANGRLTGRPQQSGSFAGLRLKLVDGDGAAATSQAFTIEATTALGITGLPETYRIRAGKPFSSTQPQTTGATSPTTWSTVGGDLPGGLSIDSRTGIVSGNPVDVAKVEGVYVRVTQDDGKSAVHGPVTYDVVGDLAVTVPDTYIRVGNPVDIQPASANRIGQLAWNLSGAPLPSGLLMSASSGRITGTPTITGTTEGVELQVVDNSDGARGTSEPFAIHVWSALRALPPGIPSAVVGTPLEIDAPSATGLRGNPTWSMVNALPPGLAFDATTRRVTGIPTQAGRFSLDYRVRDQSDNATANTSGVTVTVDPVPVPEAIALADYPEQFAVRSGGTLTTATPSVRNVHGTATFALEGTKPAWLSVNPANGQLYGIAPTVTAATTSASLRLKVTDSEGRAATSRDFTVTVRAPGPLEMGLVGPTLRARPGIAFSTGLPPVAGGSGAFTFSLGGTLPAWLAFDPATGSIVGTPETQSVSASGISVTVIDAANGAKATSNLFDISVSDGSVFPVISGMASSYAGQVAKVLSTSRPSVSGTTGQYSFSLAGGTLPAWASLDEATGRISGTPVETGLSGPFSIRVTDTTSASALSIPFTLTVTGADPIVATASASYAATSGTAFSMRPGLSNAQGSVSWAMASPFPDWAILDRSTGIVSGVPDAVGTSGGLVLKATDTTGATASTRAFSIDVAAPPPMTVGSHAGTYIGEMGSPLAIDAPAVSRSVGTVTWSLASGTLPAWASLVTSTGRISGTPNALSSTGDLSLRATDSTGNSAVGNVFSIAVQPATLRVATSPAAVSLRAGGVVNTAAPTTSGSTAAVTWSLASGTLPPWSLLDRDTGRISGTSVDAGSWNGIVLQANEAGTGRTALAKPIGITVTAANPSATVTANVEARTYNEVSIRPVATNVIGTPTWRISSGTKPAWLSIDTATGRLYGTPTSVGSVSGLVLSVKDSFDNREGATGAININIEDGTPSIEIAESSVFRAGKAFVLAPVTTDVVGATTFEITGGSLPVWANLSRSSGRISGTPTTATTAPELRMTVTDARGISGHSSDFSITSRPPVVATLDQGSLDIRPGTQVLTATPTVTGVLSDAVWSITGNLPAGVTLDTASGVISGIARSVGTFGVTLRVTDPIDDTTVNAGFFTIRVVDVPKASIAADTAARVGFPVSVRPGVSNTIGAVAWRVASGSLPAWASLDPATGTVSGIPDTTGVSSSATLEARDSQDLTAITGSFRFTVSPRIRVDLPTTRTTARVGRGYSFLPTEANGADGAVTWSLASSKPEWAAFDPATGRLWGTPAQTGSFSITYAVVDQAGNAATSATVSGTISTNPTVAVSDRTTRVNANFSFQPGIGGVVGSLSATSAGAAFPGWATQVYSTGRIFGVPNAVGTFPGLRIRIVDSEGVVGLSDPFSITVASGIAVTSAAQSQQVRISSNVNVPAPTVTGVAGTVSWSLVGSSRVDLQACKLEYSIVSPK